MSKIVMVNDVNFTPYLTPAGYTCNYRKIKGSNSGTMLDGSFMDDILAYKTTINVTFLPLPEKDYEMIISTMYEDNQDFAMVHFYDPRHNGYRDAECSVSSTGNVERGQGSDGKTYWTGLSLTLDER